MYRKPVVAILSTGNELVDIQSLNVHPSSTEWGGIFDTNRPSLQALLEGEGYKVVDLGIVPDELSPRLFSLSMRILMCSIASIPMFPPSNAVSKWLTFS